MTQTNPPYFDLQTIALLREALDDAWACLSPTDREHLTRSRLAERILKAAARGERDRERLIEAALDQQLVA
jgi:hypothetical protein